MSTKVKLYAHAPIPQVPFSKHYKCPLPSQLLWSIADDNSYTHQHHACALGKAHPVRTLCHWHTWWLGTWPHGPSCAPRGTSSAPRMAGRWALQCHPQSPSSSSAQLLCCVQPAVKKVLIKHATRAKLVTVPARTKRREINARSAA